MTGRASVAPLLFLPPMNYFFRSNYTFFPSSASNKNPINLTRCGLEELGLFTNTQTQKPTETLKTTEIQKTTEN